MLRFVFILNELMRAGILFSINKESFFLIIILFFYLNNQTIIFWTTSHAFLTFEFQIEYIMSQV